MCNEMKIFYPPSTLHIEMVIYLFITCFMKHQHKVETLFR